MPGADDAAFKNVKRCRIMFEVVIMSRTRELEPGQKWDAIWIDADGANGRLANAGGWFSYSQNCDKRQLDVERPNRTSSLVFSTWRAQVRRRRLPVVKSWNGAE